MHTLLVRLIVSVGLLVVLAQPVRADAGGDGDRWSVGTSVWMLANLWLLPDSPQFFYLEVDRALTERDALVVELVTWKYRAPIGIPYGSSYEDPAENYSGSVRSIGV